MARKYQWKRAEDAGEYQYKPLLYARVEPKTKAMLRAVSEARGLPIGALVDEMADAMYAKAKEAV